LLQAQETPPEVFVQVALAEQPPFFVRHSLTSAQLSPLPVKPLLQAQVRPPGVFVQSAFASQPPFAVAHSFTSVQLMPLPS
jgi:hypothetical protein